MGATRVKRSAHGRDLADVFQLRSGCRAAPQGAAIGHPNGDLRHCAQEGSRRTHPQGRDLRSQCPGLDSRSSRGLDRPPCRRSCPRIEYWSQQDDRACRSCRIPDRRTCQSGLLEAINLSCLDTIGPHAKRRPRVACYGGSGKCVNGWRKLPSTLATYRIAAPASAWTVACADRARLSGPSSPNGPASDCGAEDPTTRCRISGRGDPDRTGPSHLAIGLLHTDVVVHLA